jgi:hypothetical protein
VGLAVLAIVGSLAVLAVVGVLTVLLSRPESDASGNIAAIGGIVVLFLVLLSGLAAWLFLAS